MTSQVINKGRAAPLPDMPRGCKLEVADLCGSPSLRSRLYAMGILPGTEMELCCCHEGGGSVCVRVRQSMLVLGESLANAIFCREIFENEAQNHFCDGPVKPHRHGLGKGCRGWCKK